MNKEDLKRISEEVEKENLLFANKKKKYQPEGMTTHSHQNQDCAMLTIAATSKQTDKRVTIKPADLYRIEDGKIAEHCDVWMNWE
jgi:predicted SnoaL-like aldol condensation-catalyzing enzyme